MSGAAAPIVLLIFTHVPLPGTSSVTVPLSPPVACRNCHGEFDLDGAAYDTWTGSVMGHAARDPIFSTAMAIAEQDVPGAGDFCLRCHAPEAWLQGRCDPSDGSELLPEDSGVTCSVCHRMEPNGWVRNAQYLIGEDSAMRGPYGQTSAPHQTRQSSWISDARLCGTCHDVFNPLQDNFPEQTTYSEWAASAFAAEGMTCQKCHMPEVAGKIAGTATVSRADRSSHAFAGANVYLLDAIAFLEPRLGLSENLSRGRARTIGMLRTAARVELVDPPASLDRGAQVRLTFRVTNLTGHKLPTGYPDGRRATLAVNVAALGIDRPAAAVYEVSHGQRAAGPGIHLALNDTVFADSRIPPRGFVPTATTAPVGKRFAELGGGVLAHWDDVAITATVTCDPAVERVEGRAVLWFESVSRRFLERLIAEAGDAPAARRLATLLDSNEPSAIDIAPFDVSIPIARESSCDPPDAGQAPDVAAGPHDAAPPPEDAGAGDRAVDIAGEASSCTCSTGGGTTGSVPIALLLLAGFFAAFRRMARRSVPVVRSTRGAPLGCALPCPDDLRRRVRR